MIAGNIVYVSFRSGQTLSRTNIKKQAVTIFIIHREYKQYCYWILILKEPETYLQLIQKTFNTYAGMKTFCDNEQFL